MIIPEDLDVTRPPLPGLLTIAMYSTLRDYNHTMGAENLEFSTLPIAVMDTLQGVLERDRNLAVQIVRDALHGATEGTSGVSLNAAAKCVTLSLVVGRRDMSEAEAEAFVADVMREY